MHIFNKYRDQPYGLKLNLMIGVQNNNMDEFYVRMCAKQSVKLIAKKFVFPCMKNIIFQVIHKLILNETSPLTLGYQVI